MGDIDIQYRFILEDGTHEDFTVALDETSLLLRRAQGESLPEWTRLEHCRCAICPLAADTHPHCPLAASLVDVVTRLGKLLSWKTLHVDVTTAERKVSQDTTAYRAIGSLLGLICATSGCPHTAFFKPMARFHLPLSSDEETLFRSTSAYLLTQYILRERGYPAELELNGLVRIYENIGTVNARMADRLRGTVQTDALVNAIVLLDNHARLVQLFIGDILEGIRPLFSYVAVDTG